MDFDVFKVDFLERKLKSEVRGSGYVGRIFHSAAFNDIYYEWVCKSQHWLSPSFGFDFRFCCLLSDDYRQDYYNIFRGVMGSLFHIPYFVRFISTI